MAGKANRSKKRLYYAITIALVACLTLTALLVYKAALPKPFETTKPVAETQATEIPTQTPSLTIKPDTNIIRAANGTVIYNLDQAPITYPLSQQSAVKIAYPYIEAYARANNRTLLRLNIEHTLASNENKPTMDPAWKVAGEFDGFQGNVNSYGVLILIDTGEIRDKGPIGYNISEQQAIQIAQTFIQRYATQNHRTIESINATLGWFVTLKAPMGDPRWTVVAEFAEIQDYVTGYHVYLNAFDGQVYSEGPDGPMVY